MIVAEPTGGGGASVHVFEGSQGGEAVDLGMWNKGHETFGEGVDVGFPCCVGLFKVKKGEKGALGDKGLYSIIP